MCGIVGYIGKNNALPILLDGLKRLEYRGYDSAGVAVKTVDGVFSAKAAGRIAELEKKINLTPPPPPLPPLERGGQGGYLGIAHTRWATHGVPSEANAHPHCDCQGKIWLAHNGIIENYQELKTQLAAKGHRFSSETDTEVIAHLLEELYDGNLSSSLIKALKILRGAYGLALFHGDEPNKLLAARRGSPLVIGLADGEIIVASDAAAIIRHTKQVVYLNDGEVAEITGTDFKIVDANNNQVNKKIDRIEWDVQAAERSGWPHFMVKEIFEQPEALKNTMRGRLVPNEGTIKFGGLESLTERLRNLKHLTLAAMGTASFTCMAGECAMEELADIPTKREVASEFAFRSSATTPDSGLIAVSQSGETADTLNAVREAKRRGMLTLGIVNVIGSSIAREVDAGIYNHVGPEIAVASTKASTSEVLLLAMLALYLGRLRGLARPAGQAIIKEMQRLPAQAEKVLGSAPRIKALARKYKKYEDFFCLGRKYQTSSAFEGALKMKECSYIHVEGSNIAELKHGPISLIDKGLPSIVIAPRDSVYEKNKSSIEEIKARRGPVIALTTEGNRELEKLADEVLYIPQTLELLSPILAFIPLQLLAYYLAVERGNDVDKPRNLAKSVTVE